MIRYQELLGPENIFEGDSEKLLSKSIVAAKIMRNARKNHSQYLNNCRCIFCSLKGDNKEYEELIDGIIIDHITFFKRQGEDLIRDYMPPLDVIEEIMKFVDVDYYRYYPEANNLTPLMNEMLRRGVARSELNKILDKFIPQVDISSSDGSNDDLPF